MRVITPALLASLVILASSALADVPLHPSVDSGTYRSPHAAEWAGDRPEGASDSSLAQPWTPAPGATRSPDAPSATVYGYWPYWGDDLSTLPWASLTHVALFAVSLNSDGTLANTGYWTSNAPQAVSLAGPYNVKIHMTVTCFDANVATAVFSSSTNRNRAVSEIASLISAYGGDGANIDVEGLPSAQKDNFTTFIQDLQAATGEVFLATPAVDWSGAYDYDRLANASDGLFIMGYGYHWSSGDPGPIGPLYGGDPWSTYSLAWSVEDYLAWGTPRDKIILGLPLYGYDWPSTDNTVPGESTGTGTALVYSLAVPTGEQYGRLWDSVTFTPYAFPDNRSQLWYDDLESIEAKASYGLGEGLQGIGFWALTYEDGDPTFWSMIDGLTGGSGGCADIDRDHDGSNACDDCDDEDPRVSPDNAEVPNDGLDNDCDGEIDEAPSGDCEQTLDALPGQGHLAVMLVGLLGLFWRRRRI